MTKKKDKHSKTHSCRIKNIHSIFIRQGHNNISRYNRDRRQATNRKGTLREVRG